MFGLFNSKKAEKVNLGLIAEVLERRHYDFEYVDGKSDVIIVKGKYRNNMKDFLNLQLHFVGGSVVFKDERGNKITRIPEIVEIKSMYPVMRNILNLVN